VLAGSVLAALALLGPSAALAERAPFQLELPIQCPEGQRCPIETHFDHDPGPGIKDFACGSVTRNGHSGVDFRVEDLTAVAQGVPVVAAAPGTVTTIRNDVRDHSPFDFDHEEARTSSVCGNRVIVEYDSQWSTHYCHLREGPSPVKVGQKVEPGDLLGYVGMSGMTNYPHLHFNVLYEPPGQRLDIDPFAPEGLGDVCSADISRSMWSPAALAQLAYASPALINIGFADGVVTNRGIENGSYKGKEIGPEAPAIVLYARTIGLIPGDVQRMTVLSPDGTVLVEQETDPLTRPDLQAFLFTGRKLRGARWPAGTYIGFYEVLRGGEVALSAEKQLEMP